MLRYSRARVELVKAEALLKGSHSRRQSSWISRSGRDGGRAFRQWSVNRRFLKGVWDIMSPPLWAILIAPSLVLGSSDGLIYAARRLSELAVL